MPKIYDNPQDKRGQFGENHKRPAMGNGPAGPSAQTDNRVNLALIAIALAIVLVMVLFRVAKGEDLQGMASQPEAASAALPAGPTAGVHSIFRTSTVLLVHNIK